MSQFLKKLNIKPVKGTMSVHSVVSLGPSSMLFAVRETSCFCDGYFKDGNFHSKCNDWYRHPFSELSRSDLEMMEWTQMNLS